MTMSEHSSQIYIPLTALKAMEQHSLGCYPEEMCGLLVGNLAEGRVERFVACTNIAHSARVYTIDPKEHLKAELAAEKDGFDVIGSAHSHTHSEAYPSPTDVAQAPDPSWHYVIVSLATGTAVPRSFRIVEGQITEESIISA
jgi:proteasome lid subunit RPN8/RPN11